MYDLVPEANSNDDDDLHHLIVHDLVPEADVHDDDLHHLIAHATYVRPSA